MGFLLADSYCNDIKRIKIAGDSKLAIDFMKNKMQATSPNLTGLFEGNKTLARFF